MTVAFVLDFPGGTMDQYHEVVARMHLDGRLAPGGVLHVAGSYEGGLRVIDVWEDMEHFTRFRDAQLLPHIQALGLPEPAVRVLEVDEEKPGSGEVPVLVQCVIIPGLDRDAFDAGDRQIRPGDEMPAGLTFHVNGPYDGGWCVIDGWASKEARDAFLESRIRPVFERMPLTGAPSIEDLRVEATLGTAATAQSTL